MHLGESYAGDLRLLGLVTWLLAYEEEMPSPAAVLLKTLKTETGYAIAARVLAERKQEQ